jgi:predicted CXXCH cytochrome family protein
LHCCCRLKDRPPTTVSPSYTLTTAAVDTIRVIGLVQGSFTGNLACEVKGGEVIGNKTAPINKGAFTISVRLRKGLNEIIVTDQNTKVSRKLSVFLSKGDKPPEGFRPYFIHASLERVERCEDCHNTAGRVVSYKKMIPSATCASAQCHGEMGKGKFVHGPVGSGTCIACHNPHGSPQKHMVTRAGGEGC